MRSLVEMVSLTGLAILLAMPHVSFAGEGKEGTGVGGGGGNDARTLYLAKLRAQMGPSVKIGSAQASLGGTVSQWCSRIVAELQRQKIRAMNEYAQRHKFQAKQILVDAMLIAAQSIEFGDETAKPITKLLLDRGLIMSQALDDAPGGGSEFWLATEVNFLSNYVDFVVRVQKKLDAPWYIPYRFRYGSCMDRCPGGFGVAEFEREYLQYAREQLEFPYQYLTEVGGNGRVYPLGDAKVFLKVAELISGWVAQDLAFNLFAARETCVAQDLSALAEDLSAFNDSGDRSVFIDPPHAVQTVRRVLEHHAARIGGVVRCEYDGAGYGWEE